MVNLLLVIGCVLGVVGGAAPSTIKLGPLPFDWTLAIIGAVLILTAYFVNRGKPAGGHGAEEKTGAGSVSAAEVAMREVAAKVKLLQSEAARLELQQLVARLDSIIKENIQPVIDAQALIIEKQGFAKYAAHTSPWATGERLIYRAWSAATDGHRPEAIASLGESILHFEEAAREWPK